MTKNLKNMHISVIYICTRIPSYSMPVSLKYAHQAGNMLCLLQSAAVFGKAIIDGNLYVTPPLRGLLIPGERTPCQGDDAIFIEQRVKAREFF